MITQRDTRKVLFVTVAVLLVWELLTLSFGHNATISETIWNLTPDNPLIVFGAGVVVGHLWFVKGVCINCGKNPWRKQ